MICGFKVMSGWDDATPIIRMHINDMVDMFMWITVLWYV